MKVTHICLAIALSSWRRLCPVCSVCSQFSILYCLVSGFPAESVRAIGLNAIAIRRRVRLLHITHQRRRRRPSNEPDATRVRVRISACLAGRMAPRCVQVCYRVPDHAQSGAKTVTLSVRPSVRLLTRRIARLQWIQQGRPNEQHTRTR